MEPLAASNQPLGMSYPPSQEHDDWLRESKIRDEYGVPITLYHGSPRAFTSFDPARIGSNRDNQGFYGAGFYLTSDQDEAETYTKPREPPFKRPADASVMRVHANIRNPFIIHVTTHPYDERDHDHEFSPETINNVLNLPGWTAAEKRILKKHLPEDPSEREDEYIYGQHFPWEWQRPEVPSHRFTEILKQAGYDGVVVHNNRGKSDEDTGNSTYELSPFHEVVAFHPNQIKSVENQKPTDHPDITLDNTW